MKEDNEESWKHDLVEFVEHWTKKECPKSDNPADELLWLKEHFAEALLGFELDVVTQTTELSIAVHKVLMSPYGKGTNR
jgi:hypothetical protein